VNKLNVNWLAVVVCFLSCLALTLLAFGTVTQSIWKPIIEKANISMITVKDRPLAIPILVAGTFISTFALCLVIRSANIGTWWIGLCAGAILWTAFGAVATLFAMAVASVPLSLWLYNFVVQLVIYSAQGIVFSVWK
jgi:hypothetical protein